MFYRHLQPEDVPLDRRGIQGMIRNAREKMPHRSHGDKGEQ
jgi:hypothetical protein